ncbi:MAG: hypothetical protein M1831_003844 [Alyxoria varia]|nr:MAG: hypothetical protein M1831_003844 [Alyxoria varia]
MAAATSAASSATPGSGAHPSYTDNAMRAASSTSNHSGQGSGAGFKTPLSATYPSAINSPMSTSSPRFLRPNTAGTNESARTPLTPPSAYFDFLRVHSPASTNTPLSTGTSTHFSFSGLKSPAWAAGERQFAKPLTPTTRPALASASSQSSCDSDSSYASALSSASSNALSAAAGPTSAPTANSGKPLLRHASGNPTATVPATKASCPPPSCLNSTSDAPVPQSATRRTSDDPPRRPSLVIPPSPTSSFTNVQPMSAASSTMSAPGGTVNSAANSAASPNPWSALSAGRSPHPNKSGAASASPVTIRHVVTRTVTWSRPAGASSHKGSALGRSAVTGKTKRSQSPLVNTTDESSIPSESDEKTETEKAEGDDETAPAAVKCSHHERNTSSESAKSDQSQRKPLVGEAPKGKRRRVK